MPQTAFHFHQSASRTLHLDYWLSLPDDYDEDQKHPLLLFLHGAGERGDSHNGLEVVKKHGPPKRWDKANPSPFVLASPQCPVDSWWSGHIDSLMGLIDSLEMNYAIDPKRIYLTGLSMGGFGTWHLASLYPERFAAAIPICGGLPWFVDLEAAAERMKRLPIWAFHGAKDDVVVPEESKRVVKALKAVGADVTFTLYRTADHDSWTKTYANRKLYDWLLSHQRS
jgi:predicted peptidase